MCSGHPPLQGWEGVGEGPVAPVAKGVFLQRLVNDPMRKETASSWRREEGVGACRGA